MSAVLSIVVASCIPSKPDCQDTVALTLTGSPMLVVAGVVLAVAVAVLVILIARRRGPRD